MGQVDPKALWALLLFPLIALLVPGCGEEDQETQGAAAGLGKGCLQGTLIDAVSGKRIAIPEKSKERGVFVLAGTRLLQASPDTSPQPDEITTGDYVVCGLPLDTTLGIFAWVDGYQDFESRISVPSTAASRSPEAVQDVFVPVPGATAHIRLNPMGTTPADFEVHVNAAGKPVEGARVKLEPLGFNSVQLLGTGGFLVPYDSRLRPLEATSDASGNARFSAADLAAGGSYFYSVELPSELEAVSQTDDLTGTVTVALVTEGNSQQPLRIDIGAQPRSPALRELHRSSESDNPNPSGALTIYFDRPIQIAQGAADEARATLSGASVAEIQPDVTGNGAPESVAVAISGNVLTLTPVFATPPDGDKNKEPTLTVTYSGIKIVPTASPGSAPDPEEMEVTGTVSFY